MSNEELKPRFGGIPFRAVADGDLTALDLRILAVIAAHDGFNKNRKGCFASHKRIAALACAHYKSAARAITKLIDCGYLHASQQGADGRLRVYRVMYLQEDHDAFRGDGRSHAPAKPLRSVTEVVTDQEGESVTDVVTDYPEAHGGVSNRLGSGSVTENAEVGNRNDPPDGLNALNSKDETSRIYYTESNRIKNRRDLAEAPLSEGAKEAMLAREFSADEIAESIYSITHRAARYRPRTRHGPATDGDAAIEAAMVRRGQAPPVELDNIRRELSEARPSSVLMNNALCRAARGVG